MANLINNDALDIGEHVSGYGQPGIVHNGTLASVFSAQVNSIGNLEVYISTDDGTTWTLDTTFTDSVNIKVFSFADSPRGDIFIAFSYSTASDVYTIKVKKRAYDTGAWSEVLSETGKDCTSVPLKPLITWNRYESNRLHIFWLEHTSGSVARIYNQYTDNYGTSWSNGSSYPDTTYTANFNSTIDSIDTSPVDGKVYIYHRIIEAGYLLIESCFSSVGAYASYVFLPSGTNYWHRGSSSVIDSNNIRWRFLYYKYSTTPQYRLVVTDSGLAHNLTIMSVDFGDEPVYGGMVSIGRDSSDNIYVFYVKKADDICYYRKYTALTTTWEAEVALTTGDGLRPSCVQAQPSGSSRLLTTFYTN